MTNELFYKKLMGVLFREYYPPNNWMISWVTWMIDSKYRKYVFINEFLNDQLYGTTQEVFDLAMSLKKGSDDVTTHNIQKWVYHNITYVSDTVNFGRVEYWATANEVLEKGKGDCDDLNGLIYILARFAGISELKIYCVLGDTDAGLHFYCVYLSTKFGNLYTIDATYRPDLHLIPEKKQFGIKFNGYRGISYVFNEENCFKQKR